MIEYNTREYISVLRGLSEEGKEVSITIFGGSMSPFLSDRRDTVFFKKSDSPYKRGDIVFYERKSGQFVLHRICRIKNNMLYIAGDAQTVIEGPVSPSQIFAKVTRIERKGRIITPKNFIWKFFSGFWCIFLPLRPLLINIFRIFRKIFPGPQKKF